MLFLFGVVFCDCAKLTCRNRGLARDHLLLNRKRQRCGVEKRRNVFCNAGSLYVSGLAAARFISVERRDFFIGEPRSFPFDQFFPPPFLVIKICRG